MRISGAKGVAAGALLTFLAASAGHAQTRPAPLPPTNQAMFAPFPMPEANEVRTASGAPGPEYWQQEADYHIQATLDTVAHRVTGHEVIDYTNNSPDSLPYLWIQLEQNLFAPDSRGAIINSQARWRGAFPDGGDKLKSVSIVQDGKTYTPSYTVDGTRMRIDLDRSMKPKGDRLQIEFGWSFVVPQYGADRMGRFPAKQGWIYEIAQWYPRMYVYDDVHGWNPMPYLGQGEFYLEYGTFDVDLTVPRDMIVVGGGQLLNPQEVLTSQEIERLRKARTSDATVPIVTEKEVGTKAVRPAGKGPLTWKFRIRSSRDFAWAASKAFIWDAAGWDGVLLQSVYPKEGLGTKEWPGWENSTQYLHHTISYYSDQWRHYPYTSAVSVAGVVGGMEYPGIVFCSVRARSRSLFSVEDHEFGHNWYPMTVGSDERRYAWMDEGFNTFINHYSHIDFYGPSALKTLATTAPRIAREMQLPIADQPILTYPDHIRDAGLGLLAYNKPAYGLVLLREVIMGEKTFKKAMRLYTDEWAFKHPKPWDFFRTMESVSGRDLSWFWRGWFASTDVLDQAVTSVQQDSSGAHIHLENKAGLVMPVLIRVGFADGRVLNEKLPVEIWATGNGFDYDVPEKGHVTSVTLDPESKLPDIDRSNNEWVEGGGS
jgi:hypothetical protein